MAQRKTLTEAQLEVLRWIGEGCPDGVYEPSDPAHRISAAALRRRGLAETSGRGPNWSASITKTGREYLERAEGPDAPKPRQANVSVTQELVDQLLAAGGTLRLLQPRYGDPGRVDYRRRAQLAERHGRVPEGKRLAVSSPSWDEVEIRLVDAPELAALGAGEVPVPERVGRYHPLVRRFRDDRERHEVSRGQLGRAARILQGLVVEAERRGHTVELVKAREGERYRYGRSAWSGPRDGHLVITVDGHSESLRISEEGLQSRAHWERQGSRYDSWSREWKSAPVGEYEAKATGRLQIEIVGYGGGGRQAKWADRKSWTLEEKLPEVLREIELRAVEAAERQREAERLELERRRERELAIERAKERWLEEHRGQEYVRRRGAGARPRRSGPTARRPSAHIPIRLRPPSGCGGGGGTRTRSIHCARRRSRHRRQSRFRSRSCGGSCPDWPAGPNPARSYDALDACSGISTLLRPHVSGWRPDMALDGQRSTHQARSAR